MDTPLGPFVKALDRNSLEGLVGRFAYEDALVYRLNSRDREVDRRSSYKELLVLVDSRKEFFR